MLPRSTGLLMAGLLALAAPARAQTPVTVSAGVAAESGPKQEEDAPWQELRWLPVESRTDVADFVGRNLPGALIEPHGLHLRGGGPGDTARLVDGIRFRHLALPLAMVDRLEVATAGYGAPWADVAGGTVALTTRSGGNRWQAGGEVFHDFRDRVVNDVGVNAGGPIVRDRLFVLMAVQGETTKDPVLDDIVLGPRARRQSRALGGALKLTWLPNAHHRLDSLTIADGDRSDNGGGYFVEPEAQPTFSSRTVFTSLRWRGWFGERVTTHATLGLTSGTVRESPMSCRWDPEHCNDLPPIRDVFVGDLVRQNALHRETQRDRGLDLEASVEARLFGGPRIDESARLTSRIGGRVFASDASVPGNSVLLVAGGAPLERREVTPNHTTSRSLRTVHAVESTTRLWGRLSVIPGLALVTSRASNSGGGVLSEALLTPHAGVLWDVLGDGRFLMRASSHRRVDADLERFARSALPPPVENRCGWDPQTLQFSRCQLVGGQSPPLGDLRMPRTWEHTASVEGVLDFFRFGLEGVYRRRTSGEEPVRPGVDSGSVPQPRYRGLTASAARVVGRARLFVAYTLSRHDDRLGDLVDDRRHAFEALAGYDLFGHGWVSAIFTAESGRPAYPANRRTVAGIFEDYPASRLVDSQQITSGYENLSARLPATKRLNLQARLRGKRLLKVDVDLWADVINVFDWGWVPVASPFTFGTGYRMQERRSARLGLEYRY
jgi:hypothetical protein